MPLRGKQLYTVGVINSLGLSPLLYSVLLSVNDIEWGRGAGPNQGAAKEAAAERAYNALTTDH